jgi:hypothetical protein
VLTAATAAKAQRTKIVFLTIFNQMSPTKHDKFNENINEYALDSNGYTTF